METTIVPNAKPTGSFARRLIFIGLAQLVLLEILNQFFVHWRESTAELWTMAFISALFLATVWITWPIFRRTDSLLIYIPATILLCIGLGVFDLGYNFYLRPNVGLYSEDEWIAQHPGFQWGWRQGIAENLWRKPPALPFGPESEFVFSPGSGWPPGLGTSVALSEVPNSAGGWDGITPQNVANFWVFDKRPPDVNTLQVANPRTGLFVFRTNEGKMGLMEFFPRTEKDRIQVRYKILQQGPSSRAF